MTDAPLLGPVRLRLARPAWLTAAGRVAARQLAVEGFGAPGYGLTLAWPSVEGLAAAPKDFRPTDPAAARHALAGRFAYAGAVLETGRGGDPWNVPAPSRPFAVELHRFAWLPHLAGAGEVAAFEALRLTRGWRETFGRWSPFAWGREVLSRRVFNLACAARRLADIGGEGADPEVAELLARQARHLLRLPDDAAWAAEHTTAAAVAGAALAGRAGDRLLARALPRLTRALARTVPADGCHASRSPEAGMELLFDLLTLDDALLQRGREAPPEVARAVDRLTQALRFFTLGDGRLACFQGGESSSRRRVDAARAHDNGDGAVPTSLPDGRYHRLHGQLLQAIVDAGAPARGPYAVSACAQPLALEVVCGKDRLITNAGWSEREPDRQGFRLTSAGSTVTLGETSVLQPLQGRLAEILGARLDGPPFRVEARRQDPEGAVLVELAHDGWAGRYGLSHERRLYVDVRADELRAEDLLSPAEGAKARALAVPFAVRFHLHPEVQVSLARDRRSVLLRGPSGRGWWFRNDAFEVLLEPAVHFEDGSARKTAQIVLSGVARTDAPTRIRWKIAPAGGPGDAKG
ncbi:MAG TPA: heparinase II/III family protein [Caulobacteraceae bacterium]|nr:heparinase II/III family protein [Caulobacteraceae bacterium]